MDFARRRHIIARVVVIGALCTTVKAVLMRGVAVLRMN